MDEQQLLMAMMGQAPQAPSQSRDIGPNSGLDVDLNDPASDPWPDIAAMFGLGAEQVQQLQVPDPRGRSLMDRINEMRTVGGVELGVEGNQVTGRVEF